MRLLALALLLAGCSGASSDPVLGAKTPDGGGDARASSRDAAADAPSCPVYVAVGDRCELDGEACQPGSYCAGKCTAGKEIGAACTPGEGCQEAAFCNIAVGAKTGSCVPCQTCIGCPRSDASACATAPVGCD